MLRGHIEKFHLPYLEWWREHGWETWVAARDDRPESPAAGEPGRGEAPGYCEHYLDIPFSRRPFSMDNVRAYRMMRRLLREHDIDVIHTHTPVASVLTRLAARRARRRGTRVVYTAHGFHFCADTSPVSWVVWYPVEWLMSWLTDLLIVINEEDERSARRFHCLVRRTDGIGANLPAPSQTASSGDLDDVSHLWVPGTRRLLNVGDVNECKNQRVLVEALPLLPEMSLVVAGAGPKVQALQERAVRLGVADRVRFVGFRRDVPRLMAAADYFLFPSRREGLPVALMEAMAAGLVCVASSVRGSRDLLAAVPGALVTSTTAEAFAQRLRELEGDPSRRETMSMVQREVARAHRLERVLPQVVACYREIGV